MLAKLNTSCNIGIDKPLPIHMLSMFVMNHDNEHFFKISLNYANIWNGYSPPPVRHSFNEQVSKFSSI